MALKAALDMADTKSIKLAFKPIGWRYIYQRGRQMSFLMACHSCDNRVCCNPKHLFWASQKENVLDMYVKGRQNRPNGEAHGRAKLTAAEVLQIRQLAGSMTNVELASRFNISPDHAHKILVRKIWKHLEESR